MFDIETLKSTIATHGPVARVVIATVAGSSPREVGAAMLVWQTGQSGTIGGGALEHLAASRARAMLATGGSRIDHEALGPNLGQCCGGAVTLVTETYQTAPIETDVIARSLSGAPMPLAVKRLLSQARNQGTAPTPQLIQGWMVEPVARPSRHLWIWGAGHVGRALVATLAPLPELAITWIDVAPDRFPATIPEGVCALPTPNPTAAVPLAPQTAEHLILTYSHALDLELCHHLLLHGFTAAGLIGSHSKWVRFRNRLQALGHQPAQISRICCPIGAKHLGKHPQAIAIGVAAEILTPSIPHAQEITG